MGTQNIVLTVDTSQLERIARQYGGGCEAVNETMRGVGQGVVYVSQRRKLRSESGKPVHGKGIANMLRARGHDPFDVPPNEVAFVNEALRTEGGEAIDAAFRTNRPQTDRMKRLVRAVAAHLAEWSKENIKKGGLGQKKPVGKPKTYYARLRGKMNAGIVTGKYGFPPPYGVYSGRFVEGIKSKWQLGRRSQ